MLLELVILFVLGYAAASYILFRWPELVHLKRRHTFPCRVFGHRGCAGERLENTITAFTHAVKDIGVDILELDVHLSKDGQVVVCHDDLLTRLTGTDIRISESLYGDLPPISTRVPLDFSEGCYFEDPNAFDRRICLLREVFEACPQTPLNIDLKIDNMELVEKVVDLVREYSRTENTVLVSYHAINITRVNRLCPEIHVAVSEARVTMFIIAYIFGFLPFLAIPESFMEVPSYHVQVKYCCGAEPTSFERFQTMVMEAVLFNRAFIGHLERRGVKTVLWVLNDESGWQHATQLGVHGIITDKPSELLAWMHDTKHVKHNNNNVGKLLSNGHS